MNMTNNVRTYRSSVFLAIRLLLSVVVVIKIRDSDYVAKVRNTTETNTFFEQEKQNIVHSPKKLLYFITVCYFILYVCIRDKFNITLLLLIF